MSRALCCVLSDWQAADKVQLKIFANSTRRALWHAKLGFHRSSRPPVVSLHSLFSDGGHVPGVDVVVMRVYPVLVCIIVVFTTRCTSVQSAVLRSYIVRLSVRPSVCDVQVS